MYRPTRRLKLTRPIIPRMKEPSIAQAHKELENFHMNAQGSSNIEQSRKYQDNRNRYKKTKENFFFFAKRFLRKTDKLWNTINLALNKQQNRIKLEPPEVNKCFSNLFANFINKENADSSYDTLANNLPTENCSLSLHIRHTNNYENK